MTGFFRIISVGLLFMPLFLYTNCSTKTESGGGSDSGNGPSGSCSAPFGQNETKILDGLNIATNWFHASDPELFKVGNQWFMLFTSINFLAGGGQKLNILVASLPAGEPLSAPASHWQIMKNGSGQPNVALAPTSNSSAWDSDAIETVSYVSGFDPTQGKTVDRLYYLGWKEQTPPQYKIGMAEYISGAWVKSPNPVLTATQPWEMFNGGSFLGDASAYFEASTGFWHLYYQSTTTDNGPRTVTVHAWSADGKTWPAAQRELVNSNPPSPSTIAPAGPYHIDVFNSAGFFFFAGWVPNIANLNQQGLWMARNSGLAFNQTKWFQILSDKDAPSWRANSDADISDHNKGGLFGSSLNFENGSYWLFYHSVSYDVSAGTFVNHVGRAEIAAKCLDN